MKVTKISENINLTNLLFTKIAHPAPKIAPSGFYNEFRIFTDKNIFISVINSLNVFFSFFFFTVMKNLTTLTMTPWRELLKLFES